MVKRPITFLLTLAGAAMLLLVTCQDPSPAAQVAGAPVSGEQLVTAELADLDSISHLQSIFNEDEGKPRLLLILAPT